MTRGILPFCGADFFGRFLFPLVPSLAGERYQYRDLSWSAWYRPRSVGRYLSRAASVQLAMLNVDSMLFSEYDCTNRLLLDALDVDRSATDAAIKGEQCCGSFGLVWTLTTKRFCTRRTDGSFFKESRPDWPRSIRTRSSSSRRRSYRCT